VKSWFKHVQPLLVASTLGLAFGACDEKLDAGVACPALCPDAASELLDTTFFAVDLDTAIAAYPTSGEELRQFIASMGDTLQTRGVIRYDSLPQTFRHFNSAEDTLITVVDTGAYLRLAIATGDTTGAPTTIEAYDVDLGGPDDTDPNAVVSAFVPSRLLGSRTVPADSMRDSVRIPIDPDKLLAKIQAPIPGNRLRVGIKVSGAGKSSFTALTTNANSAALLVYHPAKDSTVGFTTVTPYSKTPSETFIAENLADYLVVAQAPPAPPPSVLRVGGVPGSRAYLHFDIPARILDSSQIVRASLQLTQSPAPHTPLATDTLQIQPFALLASNNVTDISRALQLLDAFACPIAPDTLFPKDSAVRSFEIINALKCWRGTTATKTPRAIAIVSGQEGLVPSVFDFFSIEAPLGVRPRLRITYLPKRPAGLP